MWLGSGICPHRLCIGMVWQKWWVHKIFRWISISFSEYDIITKKLSKKLTQKYGKGYTKTNLYNFYRFYKCFPEIFHSSSGKSAIRLTWTHYRILLQVHDVTARKWYEKEAYEQTWSVRTLQRNIDTQYYYRILQSQDKKAVEAEMREKTSSY